MSLIELHNVSYRYAPDQPLALVDISLTVNRGKFLGILGPTGAGKSTLLSMISGAVPHFFRAGQAMGAVLVDGRPVGEQSFAELSSRIGTILQDPEAQIFNLYVESELTWGAQNLGLAVEEIERRQQAIIRRFRLEPLLKRTTPTLSGGEKQRLVLASILMMNPEILLLDEPTSELDNLGTERFFQHVTELAADGITILLAEHKIEYLAQHADRIVLLNEGRIILEGTPAEVFAQTEALEACGYTPPQVMSLFHQLNRRRSWNLPLPLTLGEAVQLNERLLSAADHSGSQDNNHREAAKEPAVATEQHAYAIPAAAGAVPPIETRDLWFSYPEPNKVLALQGIELTIQQGEFLAIIGCNGSGKTTLVKQFIGLLHPTKGQVLVNGHDTRQMAIAALARSVGYVFQNPDRQIFHDLVIDEVAYGPRNLGLEKARARQQSQQVLDALGLGHLAHQNVFMLSRGQRQRVAIASILAMDPRVILIDEPTTGQDPREARSIMELLRKLNGQGYTIVVITHDMTLVAEYARRVVAVLDGRILADGPPQQIFAEPKLLELTSVRVPQITQFALATGKEVFLTLEEALEAVNDRIPERPTRQELPEHD